MNMQNAKVNTYTDSQCDVSTATLRSDIPTPSYAGHVYQTANTSAQMQAIIEDHEGGDDEEITQETTDLPLEAMVVSNSSLCAFMGAKSPWPSI